MSERTPIEAAWLASYEDPDDAVPLDEVLNSDAADSFIAGWNACADHLGRKVWVLEREGLVERLPGRAARWRVR